MPPPAPIPAAPTAGVDVADVLFTDEHGNPFQFVLQDQPVLPVLGKGMQCTIRSVYYSVVNPPLGGYFIP